MKNILAFLFLLAAVPAMAQPEPTTPVIETLQSTGTTLGISISQTTPTSVIVATGTYRFVAVQNLDTTANLFCGERSSVSVTSGAGVGIKITPGQLMYFSIAPNSNFYCINDSGSGATWAATYRGR